MSANLHFAQALLKFQRDPALFFEKVLGVTTLEEYQRDVLKEVEANDRISIAACHDLGKSYLMARIVIWFATCFPYSKVITTAPTYNQVKNILWSEIRSAHARAKYPLGGKLNLTDWQLSKEGDWFAIGFTPRNELTGGEGQGTQSSFQGFHAPYVLVVFDEATGIPHGVWTMAEGLLTSGHVKFGAIGNPTSRNSEFFNCFRSREWKKLFLSCFNSPNLIANGITTLQILEAEISKVRAMPDAEAQAYLKAYKCPRPYLLSASWVVSMGLKLGVTHPLFVSKVLGQFPEEGENVLVTLGMVENAQLRAKTAPYVPQASDRKTLGVDVARFGIDSSVITALHGKSQLFKRTFSKRDLVVCTGEVIQAYRDMQGCDVIVVDETGLGSGVVDNLREAQRNGVIADNVEIRGVQFGAACTCELPNCPHTDASVCDKAKYFNIKARMYGLLSADLKGEDCITLLDEAIYLEELPTILYSFDSKGRMVIESKDDYKKRTGRNSPDTSDSLALANFGRYDVSKIGSFATEKKFDDFVPPFAASLGADKLW